MESLTQDQILNKSVCTESMDPTVLSPAVCKIGYISPWLGY